MMNSINRFPLFLIMSAGFATMACAQPPFVHVQEDVYSFVNPNNGSGPLWSFGCTSIVRIGNDVVVSQMETGEGVAPLANTRWRILRRRADVWETIAEAAQFRQREPCPIALTGEHTLNLYVNDSLADPGKQYDVCHPHILRFELNASVPRLATAQPVWNTQPKFTDHSYRGFASDRASGELLMLNIDAETSKQHYALIDRHGVTQANGEIEFPIRACYPQVALAGGAAHVLAIGDIVEPNEEWRAYKSEQTGQAWDYVFRKLFYVVSPDLRNEGFGEPLTIADVDATAGYIRNQDLWIAPDGAAYILYTQRDTQTALLRDRFFPQHSIVDSLYLAIVKDGRVVENRILIKGTDTRQPGDARFHETPDGSLFVFMYVSDEKPGNRLMRILPPDQESSLVVVPFDPPFTSFMLTTVRASNVPSETIDVFGHRNDGNVMAYGQVSIR